MSQHETCEVAAALASQEEFREAIAVATSKALKNANPGHNVAATAAERRPG
ncbi:MAG: hypothetical protein AB7O38_04210 [Pirellulaceae bacterium]